MLRNINRDLSVDKKVEEGLSKARDQYLVDKKKETGPFCIMDREIDKDYYDLTKRRRYVLVMKSFNQDGSPVDSKFAVTCIYMRRDGYGDREDLLVNYCTSSPCNIHSHNGYLAKQVLRKSTGHYALDGIPNDAQCTCIAVVKTQGG